MTTLSKIFSRERSLAHCCMWDDSDRLGFKKFLNHTVRHNLFLRKGPRTSVWYEVQEIEEINTKIKQKLQNDTQFLERLIAVLNQYWSAIHPFVSGKQKLQNRKEVEQYYHALIQWWSAMTVLFNIPDIKAVPVPIRKKTLTIRAKFEKYSAAMDEPLLDFCRLHYPPELGMVMMPSEIGTIQKKQLPTIRKRLSGYALFDGKLYSLHQLPALLKKNNLQLEQETIEEVSVIKGKVACRGFARGKVKIILSKQQLSEFKEKEILVTEMTDPSFVPVMKKAAAIVTNEGGVTCHAAIASRELRKPCIIGTKIATKVLKNGDLVEVDATRGTIKKL